MAEPAAALDRHRAALALARQTGDRYEQARAHDGLARALGDAGRPEADEHRQQALAGYAALGVPPADPVHCQRAGAAVHQDLGGDIGRRRGRRPAEGRGGPRVESTHCRQCCERSRRTGCPATIEPFQVAVTWVASGKVQNAVQPLTVVAVLLVMASSAEKPPVHGITV